MKKITITYLLALHLVAAGLFVKSDTFEAWTDTKPSPHVSRMRLIHQHIDPLVPEGATVFLGDSITQRLATSAVANRPVNYGIGKQTTAQLIDSITNYQAIERASMIVLLIGINDFAQGKVEGIEDRLTKIFELLPKGTPLVWNGVMPTARDEWVEKINGVNNVIKSLCNSRPTCTYLDTHQLLLPLGDEAFIDGLHLSTIGYRAWINALKSHAIAIDKSNQVIP